MYIPLQGLPYPGTGGFSQVFWYWTQYANIHVHVRRTPDLAFVNFLCVANFLAKPGKTILRFVQIMQWWIRGF